jgi:serine/threonine protein kinase
VCVCTLFRLLAEGATHPELDAMYFPYRCCYTRCRWRVWRVAEYMHAMGVGHRDLKLENMLLDGARPGRTFRRSPSTTYKEASFGCPSPR